MPRFRRHNYFDFTRWLTNIWLCRLRGVFSSKRPQYLGKYAYNIPTHMNLLYNRSFIVFTTPYLHGDKNGGYSLCDAIYTCLQWKTKQNCLGKPFFWKYGFRFVSTKLFVKKLKKTKKQKHESVHNLWRILGMKLVHFVDFWDHIFKIVFPRHFF